MAAVEALASETPLTRAAEMLGGRRALGRAVHAELDVHDLILLGLPGRALNHLVSQVVILKRPAALEKAVGMSLRTYQRRREAPDTPLSPEQGGRAWKFAELMAKATRVLGTQEEAEAWFEQEAIGLDGRRPLDLLSTPAGVKAVERYLGQMLYGVYV